MSKLTKKETEIKKAQAKDLYLRDFTIDTIAEMIGLSAITINRWCTAGDWVSAKKAEKISIQEMKRTILNSFNLAKEGQKPPISADEAIKYANAFEKLSDKGKQLPMMFESFDALTDEINRRLNASKTKKDKEYYLNLLKGIRPITQYVIEQTAKDQYNFK